MDAARAKGKAAKARQNSEVGNRIEHAIAAKTGFTSRKRIRLYERLYRFTKAGRDIRTALSGAAQRMEKSRDARRVIWRRWLGGISSGRKFSELIGPYIPTMERMMLVAGERTGKVDDGFKRAQYIAEIGARMKGTLTKAMIYPVILLAAMTVVLYVSTGQMLPMMEDMAPLSVWPGPALAFRSFATAVREYGVLMLVGAALLGAWVAWALPRWIRTGTEIRLWVDHRLIPFTIYREFQTTTYLLCISSLMASGIGLPDALRELRQVASPWMAYHIDRALGGLVGRGEGSAKAIDTRLIGTETMGDIYDFDASGSFAEALEIVARDIATDAMERLQAQAAVVNGLLLAAVGGVLLWTIVSMFTLAGAMQAHQTGVNAM